MGFELFLVSINEYNNYSRVTQDNQYQLVIGHVQVGDGVTSAVGTPFTASATIKLKEEGKTGNQRDQCVEDDEAFSERFVWQDAHKSDQAQEEEFHAEESGATPTGSSARGESGQLDGHGPPGTEPDQRERAIALAEALSSEYPQRPPPAPGRGPAAIVARPAPVHRPTTGADPACV